MIDKVIIGNATLYHGDCMDVLPTLGNDAHMIFMDPPYGHKNNDGDLISNWEKALGKLHKPSDAISRPIANDGEEANDLLARMLPEINRILIKAGCCCCCCCGGGGPDPQFARWSLMIDKILNFKQMVVWDKGPMGMGWHYRRSYETVLVAEKSGGSRWFDETEKIENIIRPGQYGIRKIIPQADDHPTPKPPALAAHFIRLHTLPGEIVVDPFMGGGSTGVACMNLGRKFIGIELERRWFDKSCERIENAQRQGQLFVPDRPGDAYDQVSIDYDR